MAVPQLQLANLGEIYAQNQARQASMDNLMMQQQAMLEQRQAQQAAAQKQTQLLEMAKTVDISTPEGAKQAFQAGLLDLGAYQDVQKAASDMALAEQQRKTAKIQGQTSQERLAVEQRKTDAQIAKWRRDSNLDAQRTDIARQQMRSTLNQQQIEIGANVSRALAGISDPKQRQAAYIQALPILRKAFPDFEMPENVDDPDLTAAMAVMGRMGGKEQAPLSTIGKLQEDYNAGRITKAQLDAAMAKATTPPGRRITTSPTGAVVIEEGVGAPVGGQSNAPGLSPKASAINRDLDEIIGIASGERGPVSQFLATGAPSITGQLGAFTPAGYVGKKIDTVKAALTIEEIQSMRERSPTGAALGNASDKDVKLLENAAGTLAQTQNENDFLRNAKNVQDKYNDTVSGTPEHIVSMALNNRVNVFDAADLIKRNNPENYLIRLPSLQALQTMPPTLIQALNGMKARDQQTGQTIVIGQQPQPTPAGGGQGNDPLGLR